MKDIIQSNIEKKPEPSLSNLLIKKIVKESNQKIDKDKYKRALDNVEELFAIMNSMYGNLWALNYENNHSRDLWTAGLMDLEKEDIVNGINYCIKNQNRIPTLPEFRKMCLEKNKDTENRLPLFK